MLSVFMNRNKTIVSGLAWCTKEMSDKKVHLFHDCKIDNENLNEQCKQEVSVIESVEK